CIFADVDNHRVADESAATRVVVASENRVLARQHAEQAKVSIRPRPLSASPISAGVSAISRNPAKDDRHARNRLPAAAVNHPPINLLSPFRIGDGDVNIGGLRGFTDLDHLRLGFTGRIRVKDEWIEFATRNNTGRTGTLRIAYADYIATFRQPIDAILTAIISLVYVVAQDVKEGCLGPIVRVDLAEPEPLFNHRPALRIGDPSGDHAAALDFEVDVFDLLAFGEIERLAAQVGVITVFGRGIPRRERGDRIPSGGDAGEMEPPALISPGAWRIGR